MKTLRYTLLVIYVIAAQLSCFWMGRLYQKDMEEAKSFKEGYKKGFRDGSRSAGPAQELFQKILKSNK